MEEQLRSAMPTFAIRPVAAPKPPVGVLWADREREPEERAQALLAEMSTEEKSALLYGRGLRTAEGRYFWQAFVQGNDRLGIPDVTQGDSPAAILVGPANASQIPSEVALGASFDAEVATQAAQILGGEARALGYSVLHAPTLDVTRDPRHGRCHENFGEDVHLVATQAEAYLQGLDSSGVVADIKHFGLNSVETDRLTTDSVADTDRVVGHYLAPFRRVIANHEVWMIMTAYAKINGRHVNDSPEYFELLRKEWGFRGIARNDANAVHSLQSLAYGLDQEFRDEDKFGKVLLEALADGSMEPEVLDAAVSRILTAMFASGLFDNPATPDPDWSGPSAASQRELAELAARCAVLLRNDGILPLDPTLTGRVAVFGPAAADRTIAGGPTRALENRDTVLEGIVAAFPAADVRYTPGIDPLSMTDTLPGFDAFPASVLTTAAGESGVEVVYFDDADSVLAQRREDRIELNSRNWALGGLSSGALPPEGTRRVEWRATWTVDHAGDYQLDVTAGGDAQLSVDDVVVLTHAGRRNRVANTSATVALGEGPHSLHLTYVLPDEHVQAFVETSSESLKLGLKAPEGVLAPSVRAAAAEAAAADVVVVVVRDFASEGLDRSTLALPGGQDQLIETVAAANPRTVVVLLTASAILTPWRERVAALVAGWYGGTQGGSALGSVLSGREGPGGRLPVTFPAADRDLPTYPPERFPGVAKVVRYDEPESGYRYFDHQGTPAAAYPFGFGLAYTQFTYGEFRCAERVEAPASAAQSALRAGGLELRLRIANTGARRGRAVPQVYLRAPGEEHEVLASFAGAQLEAGDAREVEMRVDFTEFARFRGGAWVIPQGRWELTVRSDARTVLWEHALEVVES